MVKKFLLILALWGFGVLPSWAQTYPAFKDSQGNFYIDNLPPNLEVYLQLVDFFGSGPNTPVAQLREDPTRYPCGVRVVWDSRKFRFGAALKFQGGNSPNYPLDLNQYTSTAVIDNPCQGTSLNPALTWNPFSNDWSLIRGINPCFQTYQRNGATQCQPAQVIYISGVVGSVQVSAGGGKKRFLKTNSCGFLRVPNTAKWPFSNFSYFALMAAYGQGDARAQFFGGFTPFQMGLVAQIPRCIGGNRYLAP